MEGSKRIQLVPDDELIASMKAAGAKVLEPPLKMYFIGVLSTEIEPQIEILKSATLLRELQVSDGVKIRLTQQTLRCRIGKLDGERPPRRCGWPSRNTRFSGRPQAWTIC